MEYNYSLIASFPFCCISAFSNCMKKQYCTKILYEACASIVKFHYTSESKYLFSNITFPELHPDTLFSVGNKGHISASLMLMIHNLGNTQGNVK